MFSDLNISVIIPCYKVDKHIEGVIESMPEYISQIICVNDASPDNTQNILLEVAKSNSKIIILKHDTNQGVGGAMITGFGMSLKINSDITIKIDGDGQMNLKYLPDLIRPIVQHKADFSKGNRFRNQKALLNMPFTRRIGNLGLSFLTKAASGYWNIFDPTNGFFVIDNEILRAIDFDRLHKRYFFESSLLIELYHVDAVIKDVSMDAQYGNEVSNLSVTKALFEFPPKLLSAFLRRIIFKYFLNDFSIGSVYLIFGIPMMFLGIFFGVSDFIKFTSMHQAAPTGTVIIPTLLITLSFQLLLSFVNFDVNNFPKK